MNELSKSIIATVILFVIFFGRCYSNSCSSWILNDKMEYKFGYISLQLYRDGTMEPSKYIVIIDLDSTREKCIASLSYNDWITLLKDSNSGYAANLLLYSLTEKDALLLYVSDDRQEGILLVSDEDMAYWSAYLRKNLPLLMREEKDKD